MGRFFVASDLHGSAYWCEKMLEKYRKSGAERLLLLGDILYHGPRNDLPRDYAPKELIAMLNPLKDRICAVRGNCEAEVDQMVLDFPVLADYTLLLLGKTMVFATHGHLYNEEKLPPMTAGTALLHGHTHLLKAEWLQKDGFGFYHLNPGSVSMPKGGNPNSYAILEENGFTVYDFSEQPVASVLFDCRETGGSI